MPKIVEFEKEPKLEELQHAVGGCIELVPYFTLFKGRRCVAYCDEEGKLKLKPVNIEASVEWAKTFPVDDVIVGDVAIVYEG